MDILDKINKSVEAFNTEYVSIVTPVSTDGNRYLINKNEGYRFNQKQMLVDIELAYNSIYKTGQYDSEGQRKAFINVVRFYVQVAKKNTDIDPKNFVFTPTDYSTENVWGVWFTKRQFSNWLRTTPFAKEIDDLHTDFNKYGSCVAKKVKNDIVRVPLRTIVCDQAADSLIDGIKGGVPLIIIHEYSHIQMQDFKTWKQLEKFDGKKTVYEVYQYMTRRQLGELKGETVNDESYVMTFMICAPCEKGKDGTKKGEDEILFIEEMKEDEFPFEEAHSEKVDGRWLGLGNVEKQLENQIARNTSANMRRRSMLWSSKKIFQTQGDSIGKNLVKNVQDGEILQVGLNGLISPVDTSSRGLNDFTQDEQIWEDNGQKQSFAFDVATGESMPSGTPFRLGAVLSNSVMSYFDHQKEIYGRFLQGLFYNQIIPIFEKRAKDDIAIISRTDEGYNRIKDMFVSMWVNDYYTKLALSEDYWTADILGEEEVKAKAEADLKKHNELYVDLPKDLYKNAKYSINLDITGEERDVPADRETLVTLYTEMARKNDPRAEQILEVILASAGKNIEALAGKSASSEGPTQSATAQNPNLQGLVPQTQ